MSVPVTRHFMISKARTGEHSNNQKAFPLNKETKEKHDFGGEQQLDHTDERCHYKNEPGGKSSRTGVTTFPLLKFRTGGNQ